MSAELQEFERQDAAEYLARLAADEDLVRFLQLSNFDILSDEWRQFAQALAEYGYAVFRAWLGTGEIVRRLAMKTVRGRTQFSPARFVSTRTPWVNWLPSWSCAASNRSARTSC